MHEMVYPTVTASHANWVGSAENHTLNMAEDGRICNGMEDHDAATCLFSHSDLPVGWEYARSPDDRPSEMLVEYIQDTINRRLDGDEDLKDILLD